MQASGLTKREREVAAFVAEGLTNRDIADRLVISDRTVETHVEHIRNKLGVRSRAQVATWTVTGGEFDEKDQLSTTVERVIGGQGNDTILGSRGGNVLIGGLLGRRRRR